MIADAPSRKPRRMLQPTKDYIRAELKLAEAEIDQLRNELARASLTWWGRFISRFTRTKSSPQPVSLSKDSK